MGKSNQNGFTLLEMLLVLSVVFMLTAIIIPIGKKWTETKVDEEAVQTIIATIHSLQSYALAHGVWARMEFYGSVYVAHAGDGVEFSKTVLPEGMHIAGNNLDEIIFLPNGNIVKPGTVVLSSKSGRILLRIQFVRGRVIVSE